MVSALSELAEQLSSPTLPVSKIRGSLKVHGFRASIAGLRKVLDVSCALNSHFQQLEQIFPNTIKIVSCFRTGKDIHELLSASTQLALDEPTQSANVVTSFCEVIEDEDFQLFYLTKYPILAESLAFFWLIHACIQAHQDAIVPSKLFRLLSSSLKLNRYIPYIAENEFSEINILHISLQDHMDDMTVWIEYASNVFSKLLEGISSLEDIKEGFFEATEFLKKVNFNNIYNNEIIKSDDGLDSDLQSSNQRGSGLNERERLIISHNSFRQHEIVCLSKKIGSIATPSGISSNGHYSDSRVSHPHYYIEVMIISLALATGRTIGDAVKFPLLKNLGEYLYLGLYPGHFGKFNYVIWHRELPTEKQFNIPLPEFLSDQLKPFLKIKGTTNLEDCLPYSDICWEDRCFAWLEAQIGGLKYQINRKIRDALARALYQSSASSSLLTTIATPSTKDKHRRESLSNYLDPLNVRTIDAYANACNKIFRKYGAPKITQHFYKNNPTFSVTVDVHQDIAKIFIRNINDADIPSNYITRHNWIARYILMALVVATGHRKSKTPFFFFWDILTTENLVFICDKLVVGSEARFVPIPSWLSELVNQYKQHLQLFAERLYSEHPQLAESINNLITGGGTTARTNRRKSETNSSSSSPDVIFGCFFIVDDDFNPITITTRDLEKCYSPISSNGIGLLRKSVANSLWSEGMSGHQIEAFLGHNGEQHAFGESSAWSIFEWAADIRKAQETYLSQRGWQSVKINTRTLEPINLLTPNFETTPYSYEGRKRSAHQALLNAKGIIRDLLPAEWFEDGKATITDADVLLLKEAAKERLSQDKESSDKVNQALALEIEKIRHGYSGTISSAIANLARTEAGPVEVTSSRYYSIASSIRTLWLNRIGNYLNDPTENQMDRLAHIGISLVIFDAVLDLKTWESLLLTIADHGTRSAHGCLLVRSKIEKSSRVFEKSLILSPPTAAQLIGFEFKHSSAEFNKLLIKDVNRRINKWLQCAQVASEKFALEQLMTVFKSWWLLRLPGAQYAVATGSYSGPAPDIVSECAIYGISCVDSASLISLDGEVEQILTKSKIGPTEAIKKINMLLKEAEGKFEHKNSTSRLQRNRLMQLLQDEKHLELKNIASKQQIVSIMLDFLQYMIEEGGKKLDILRFNSIRTYFSNIHSMIEKMWDKVIEDLEVDDYNNMYSQLLQGSSQSYVPISLFHKFLSETFDAPYSSVAAGKYRVAIQCRSALITPGQHENTWGKISRIKNDDGQLIFHSKSYLGIGYNYGLRTREALGLSLNDVISPNPIEFRIVRNNARDLKTKKYSLRIVTPLTANTKFQTHLARVVGLAQHAPSKNESLFADTEFKNQLYSKSRIGQVVTTALRSVTGNLSVVPYSMRHSAATRLAHFVFRSPRKFPLSEQVENALKGSLDVDSITACFDQGFSAWPFWVDRVGMYLGHSGVDTLLNTYWHTSHVCLAEHTWHASQNIQFRDQQLASMLGRDRTSIVKQYGRLVSQHTVDLQKPENSELLISHYINKSDIPKLGDDIKINEAKKASKKLLPDTDEQNESSRWVAYDRLLSARLDNGHTFERQIDQSQQFYLGKKDARKFFDAYRFIVQNFGFDDFEPGNSEILTRPPKRSAGCLRGAAERERGLTAAHRLSKSSPIFAGNLNWFVGIWLERSNPESPWFVAYNKDELIRIMDVLKNIGAKAHQFQFCHYHFDISQLQKKLSPSQLTDSVSQKTRIGSGPKNARVSEIGVRVGQESGTAIGDYRDTHRLALVLAAIVRASV